MSGKWTIPCMCIHPGPIVKTQYDGKTTGRKVFFKILIISTMCCCDRPVAANLKKKKIRVKYFV